MKHRRWRLAAFIGTVALVVLTKLAMAGAVSLTDTTGRQIDLTAAPQRIVALTPSAVETLFAIGAGQTVVGRGTAAVFPPEAEGLPVVGSLEDITRLRPDLIVSHPNHHCFSPPVLEQLKIPVLLLRHQSVEEVLTNITLLGTVTGRAQQVEALLGRCTNGSACSKECCEIRWPIRASSASPPATGLWQWP